MDSTEAISILRGATSPASVLHPKIAADMGASALEAWAWVERKRASVRPFGLGWGVAHTDTVSGDRVFLASTAPTPLTVVLDAMEKEATDAK